MLCIAGAAGVQAAPPPLDLTLREGAVTRSLSVQNWRTDRRGVPSFDYHYRQSGPDCTYQRDGRAVAGFEDLGDKVELEVFNPQGDDGRETAPIAVFYDADGSVVFSMPVPGKGRPAWVSFDDAAMKKKLPKKCGHAGRGEAVMFRK
ncbi:hypothetical protein [Pseudoduganella lurida]|uniref:hypothetical protein n=1 Tax=Pseudoduganella lurida TaxID=1036180 RepID=UPI0011A50AD6|nr:hypothetical protein [Pseudoduganella lurida]